MITSATRNAIKKEYQRIQIARKQIQELGSTIGRLAKQAIFSFQRGEEEKGKSQLQEAEMLAKKGNALAAKDARLASEGVWRAGMEEFAEAQLFADVVFGATTAFDRKLMNDPDMWIGGIADCVGEMVRYAVRAATAGDLARVKMLFSQAEELVAFLTSLDLTGSLRAKGDQARQHLRRFEDLRYEVSRR